MPMVGFGVFQIPDLEQCQAVVEEAIRVGYRHFDTAQIGDIFGAWRAMEELYKEGKIRAIGVSNFKSDQLANLAAFNEVTPAVNQIELHVFNQRDEERAYMAEKGVVAESWGALAAGQFDVFSNPVLVEIARKYEKTTSQVMLRWHLQLGLVSLAKSVTPARIQENFDIFDFELSAEDMEKISSLNTNTTLFEDHYFLIMQY